MFLGSYLKLRILFSYVAVWLSSGFPHRRLNGQAGIRYQLGDGADDLIALRLRDFGLNTHS